MIVQGSLRYTTCGRKVSSKAQRKRRQQVWHWKKVEPRTEQEPLDWKHSYRKVYPSASLGDPDPAETQKTKHYTSSHTVAPAYNKGAYQVISRENIKDIGR